MARYRELRDPIHGFIRIEDRECDVVDSPAVQRLRRVRQLAMAYLVYPGATHSRFEHSLGVVHVAGLMCQKLGIETNGEEESYRRTLTDLLLKTGEGRRKRARESPI